MEWRVKAYNRTMYSMSLLIQPACRFAPPQERHGIRL